MTKASLKDFSLIQKIGGPHSGLSVTKNKDKEMMINIKNIYFWNNNISENQFNLNEMKLEKKSYCQTILNIHWYLKKLK